MFKLDAEEELTARAVSAHVYLEERVQRDIINRLSEVAGIAEPPRKPTRGDIARLGIKVQ